MNKLFKKVSYAGGIAIASLAIGLSLQLVHAWVEPSATAPGGNLGAPIKLNSWQGNHYSGSDGAEYAVILYDANNSGYYVDPSITSYIQNLYAYGWMYSQIMYDTDNSGYYVDPNSSSSMHTVSMDGSLCLNGDCRAAWPTASAEADTLATVTGRGASTGSYVSLTGAMNTPYIYDTSDTSYYIDPNNASMFNDLRMNVLYDKQNASYYVIPRSTSRMNEIQANRVYGFSDVRSPIFYDYNNTGYYVDPASTSRLNYGVFDNLYSYGWMYYQIMYDTDNSDYYVDPSSYSRLYYETVDYLYSNGYIIAENYINTPSLCINGDCRSSWADTTAIPQGTLCGVAFFEGDSNGNYTGNSQSWAKCKGQSIILGGAILCPTGYTAVKIAYSWGNSAQTFTYNQFSCAKN